MTRKTRLQRLSRLFTIEVHFSKLDAGGSNPLYRSMFSITYRYFNPELSLLFKGNAVRQDSQRAENKGLQRVNAITSGWTSGAIDVCGVKHKAAERSEI